MRYKLLVAEVVVLAAWSAGAWTPDDQMKVKGVGDVQVSPDGRRVVFTVTEQVIETEKSETRTHIWLARADGSDSYQLTRGEKSCDNRGTSCRTTWRGLIST